MTNSTLASPSISVESRNNELERLYPGFRPVTSDNKCPHCGKADWCYFVGNLSVCKREFEPASGWQKTSKQDKEGTFFYAPTQPKKKFRPKQKREHVYQSRDDKPLAKVHRIDDGNGKKRIWQSSWDGKNWIKGLTDKVKQEIPIYRYPEIRKAIAEGKPIFFVEGETVADLLWEKGLAATTTIGGAGKYRAYGNYDLDLEGAEVIVLCPDRDKPGLAHMEEINKDYPDAKWLYAPPGDFYWSNLPTGGGLDLADWIEEGATVDEIMDSIEDRKRFIDSLNRSLSSEAKRDRPASSKFKKHLNLINAAWGHRLRWNELKKYIELDGERLLFDGIKVKVCDEFDIDISKEDIKEILIGLAKRNSYSPVKEYFDSLPPGDVSILDDLAERHLGTSDPLQQTLLKRTLIAAIARTYDPGCKHDTICILQGNQGAKKSTFWEVLAGKKYFTDDLMSGSAKDEILKISQYLIIEFSEFETTYHKKTVSALKAFLTRKADSIRKPYGVDVEDVPRPSIFVGSTNQDEFLYDPTGERRYWVIQTPLKKINLKALELERDAIWAAAKTAYLNGEQWWLTPEEDQLLDIANQRFAAVDSWQEVIEPYLRGCSEITVGQILTHCLKIEVAKHDRASQMRVADILKRLGWGKGKRKKVAGKTTNLWSKLEGVHQVGNEVVTQLNLDMARDTEDSTNLYQPKINFSEDDQGSKFSPPPLETQEVLDFGMTQKSEIVLEGNPGKGFEALPTSDYQPNKSDSEPIKENLEQGETQSEVSPQNEVVTQAEALPQNEEVDLERLATLRTAVVENWNDDLALGELLYDAGKAYRHALCDGYTSSQVNRLKLAHKAFKTHNSL